MQVRDGQPAWRRTTPGRHFPFLSVTPLRLLQYSSVALDVGTLRGGSDDRTTPRRMSRITPPDWRPLLLVGSASQPSAPVRWRSES